MQTVQKYIFHNELVIIENVLRSGSKPLEVWIRTGVRLLGTPDRGTAFDDELVLNQNEKEKKNTFYLPSVNVEI